MLYRGYQEDWHSNTKNQFDGYKCSNNEVYYFVPEERNITLEYMPVNTILVDIAITSKGWRVCHHQTLKKSSLTSAPITNLVQYLKSKPTYISQYYEHIQCEMSKAEVYQAMETTELIMMATDGGATLFKGSLRFVITNSESKVLISCYGQTVGHDPLSF